MAKSYKHLYLCYLSFPLFLWLLLSYWNIAITSEFLSTFLKIVLESLIAIVVLAFGVQIPRLEQHRNDLETIKEIKYNWRKFLQRFLSFIIFLLTALLLLEFVAYPIFASGVLALTCTALVYIFEASFSFVRNI